MNEILFLLLLLGNGQSTVTPEMRAEAGKLFQAQEWAKAAAAYEAIAKLEPNNAGALYRLGYSRHLLGDHARAAEAYERSAAIAGNPVVFYNLACVQALLGRQEQSFASLERAIRGGFTNIDKMKSDPELAGLRSLARFAGLMEQADRAARPCFFDPRYREFDFWVGDWEVRTPQGAPAGRNIVERVEQGCLLVENWTSTLGGTGKSANFFDAGIGKWRQVWISSTGQVSEFTGEYKDGAMRFVGENHGSNGNRITSRLTFFNLEPGRVRQLGEQSTDGGKTWTTSYDLIYTLKKS